MGASQTVPMQRQIPEPQTIAEFRKLPYSQDHYVIPEDPQKRKVTDFKFTVVLATCLCVLVPFLIYTLVYSDIDRLIHGYDTCGNICGKQNVHVDGISCSGVDMTGEPFLQYREKEGRQAVYPYYDHDDTISDESDLIPEKCVDKCAAGYEELFNRCFPNKNSDTSSDTSSLSALLSEIAHDINASAGHIVALCLIGLGFSVGMLFLFRYFVSVVVWVILTGSLLGIITLTGLFWYLNGMTSPDNNGFRFLAIFFTILSVILVALLICMFKRIQLLIRLFKEAIKVIFGIPLILFEPLLTFVASSILVVIMVYLLILIETSGTLQHVALSVYEYSPNGVMLFTLCYHLIICIWMAQFIIGCQHMVIAGSVSAYYFTRNKSALGNPIYNSFYNLIRYHLGTVAFGSLIITIVTVIKAMLRGLMNSKQAKALIDCCMGTIEDFLKYLSKNAYIQTAMHGQSFYKSGKRAVRLLAANALSAIAINSVGDFVLFMAKLLIIVCTIGVGILIRDPNITHFWAAIVIGVVVTAIIADCFFAVFETAIDTIFICFCEDSCMNDGETRPYYMSTEFMQYMEEAKKTNKEY